MRDQIAHPTKKSGAISVELQVLAALSYMATPSFQLTVADLLGITQASVCHCLHRVTRALQAKAGFFIHFPRDEEVLIIKSSNFK